MQSSACFSSVAFNSRIPQRGAPDAIPRDYGPGGDPTRVPGDVQQSRGSAPLGQRQRDLVALRGLPTRFPRPHKHTSCNALGKGPVTVRAMPSCFAWHVHTGPPFIECPSPLPPLDPLPPKNSPAFFSEGPFGRGDLAQSGCCLGSAATVSHGEAQVLALANQGQTRHAPPGPGPGPGRPCTRLALVRTQTLCWCAAGHLHDLCAISLLAHGGGALPIAPSPPPSRPPQGCIGRGGAPPPPPGRPAYAQPLSPTQ